MKVKIYKIKMKKGEFKGQEFETLNIPYGNYVPAHNDKHEIITHEGNFDIIGSREEEYIMTQEQEESAKEMFARDFNRVHGTKMTGYELEALLNGRE